MPNSLGIFGLVVSFHDFLFPVQITPQFKVTFLKVIIWLIDHELHQINKQKTLDVM